MKLHYLFILVLLLGCQQRIGGDKDEHGCLVAAGYQWCDSSQQCVRAWETYCEELKEQFRVRNFLDCVEAGNPVMESYPQQCRHLDKTYTEELCSDGEEKYYCNEYTKVVHPEEGRGATYYVNGRQFECPVVAPDAMSDSCKEVIGLECEKIC